MPTQTMQPGRFHEWQWCREGCLGLLSGVCWVLIAMGLVTSCCKKTIPPGEDGSATLVALDDAGIKTSSAARRDAKTDRTIRCFNAAMRIDNAADEYFRHLGGGLPRPGRVPTVLFQPQPSPALVCQMARTPPTPAMTEIDNLMPRYVDIVAALARQLEDMDRYYKEQEYRRDGFKRGKEMHEAFKVDHEEYRRLHEALAECIDEITIKRNDESIENESRNAGLRYHSLVFLRDTGALMREVAKANPNADQLVTIRNRTQASHQELTEHAASHPSDVETAFMFSTYKGKADTFMVSVRSLGPNKRSPRDLDNAINNYNAMIDASNLVRWRP